MRYITYAISFFIFCFIIACDTKDELTFPAKYILKEAEVNSINSYKYTGSALIKIDKENHPLKQLDSTLRNNIDLYEKDLLDQIIDNGGGSSTIELLDANTGQFTVSNKNGIITEKFTYTLGGKKFLFDPSFSHDYFIVTFSEENDNIKLCHVSMILNGQVTPGRDIDLYEDDLCSSETIEEEVKKFQESRKDFKISYILAVHSSFVYRKK
jgi:hypothetical protein